MTEEVEREKLTQTILAAQQRFFELMQAGDDPDWMNVELTMPQFKILCLVYLHGPVRMSMMAKLLNKNMSTATGIVDRLVDDKLIRREEDPEDRRAVIVRLTPKGQELCDSFMQQGGQRFRALLIRMNMTELETVLQAFEIFLRVAQAERNERRATAKNGIIEADQIEEVLEAKVDVFN